MSCCKTRTGSCGSCHTEGASSSCGGTSGCGGGCSMKGEVTLTEPEAKLIKILAELAFLPVISDYTEEEIQYSLLPKEDFLEIPSIVVAMLEQKHIITVDADLPISGFSYGDIPKGKNYHFGSIAFTVQGQEVADWLG